VAGEVLAGGKFYNYEILVITPNMETPKSYFNLRMELTTVMVLSLKPLLSTFVGKPAGDALFVRLF
jgi:hypothetical protein